MNDENAVPRASNIARGAPKPAVRNAGVTQKEGNSNNDVNKQGKIGAKRERNALAAIGVSCLACLCPLSVHTAHHGR